MKLSVCIATYNGALHIKTQVDSILKQLGRHDQVVIVDDASTDSTISILYEYKDPRIEIYRNKSNIGAALTFNKALQLAQGQLIFLSDQDDCWDENKVRIIKDIFLKQDVDLIIHDARVVSGEHIVYPSLFIHHGSGPGIFKNILSNTYTGCCMVFRKDVLKKVLPISSRVGLGHDAWIGILSEFFNFRTIFIKEKLIDFNRHGFNASSMKRRPILLIIRDRIHFISALIWHIIKDKFSWHVL
jgi:glycosyltransferase involved in cell wall biosynthesis